MHATAFSVVLMLLAGMFSGGVPEQRADPAAEAKKTFNAVLQHLEPGGDALFILNTENAVRGLGTSLPKLVQAATEGKDGEDAAKARQVAAALPAFLERNGFLALRAAGLSSVPETGGIHRTRAFLLRDTGAAESPLWRGLVGGPPRALAGHSYWTEDVAWAVSGTGDPTALWTLVQAAVDELLPESRAGFESALAEAGMKLGLDLNALMASLGDEAFIALTLDGTATFTVPDLGIPLPTPGLLVGLRLKQPLLAERLQALTRELEGKVSFLRTTVDGSELVSVPVPAPVPFPVQPTFAYRPGDGMLLLGSSTDTVRRAIEAAASGQRRLLDSEDFRAECGGPVGDNNGVAYVGRRFGKALAALQQAIFEKASTQDASSAPLMRHLKAALPKELYDVTVIVNSKEGVLLRSRGTLGTERYVQAGLVAPAGVMAGMLFPAIANARQKAQQVACVNNLRMLDAAKEQWAMETNAAQGAEPDAAGIAAFLKGGVLPTCPVHHVPYRLNAMGTNPECTSGNPGHRLP